MRDVDLINLLDYLLNIFPDIQCLIDEEAAIIENLFDKAAISTVVNEITQFVDVLNSCSISLYGHLDYSLIGDCIREIIDVTADLVIKLNLFKTRLTGKYLIKEKTCRST